MMHIRHGEFNPEPLAAVLMRTSRRFLRANGVLPASTVESIRELRDYALNHGYDETSAKLQGLLNEIGNRVYI